MSNKEIKEEIHKAIENIPDSLLQDILEYLNQLKGVKKDALILSRNLGTILREDKELLQKLA
jgi:hypothetical protein